MLGWVSFRQNYEEASAAVILSLLPHPHLPRVDSVLWFLFGSSPWEAGVFLMLPDVEHILCQQRHPSATLFRESAWQGSSWLQSSLASRVRIRFPDPPALASSHGFPLGPTPAPRRLLGEVLVVAAVFSSFLLPRGLSKDRRWHNVWGCQNLWAGF